MIRSLALSFLIALLVAPARGDEPFALKGGERVVFLGDSITQAGDYIVDFEAFLLTRFPEKTFTILNHGLSSETASGTSEPDHSPRRPCIHDRFDRDVTPWKPDVVVACYGMNDGNYMPYLDAGRFDLYQRGIRRLVSRIKDDAHARPLLLTPPPYDGTRLVDSDPKAKDFGYKHPSPDYDRTLRHYADWLLTLRGEGLTVADVHKSSNQLLHLRRVDHPSFHLAGDAVHPGATGHFLIAETLLLALNAPAVVAEARVSADPPKVESGVIRDLRREGDSLRFTWTTPLPMPLDPACDAASIAIEHVSDRLNRHRLAITGLPPGRYRLLAAENGTPAQFAESTSEQLASGIDLIAFPGFPTNGLARSLRSRLAARHRATDSDWRAHPDRLEIGEDPGIAEIRAMARPRDVAIVVEAIPGP